MNMVMSITFDSAFLSTLYGILSIFTSRYSMVEQHARVHPTFHTTITFPTTAGYTYACGQTSRSRTPHLIVVLSSIRDISSI
jgi:hypothetical protein